MKRYVTFYSQDSGDKSRHRWIRLMVEGISRKMDNRALSSAGFDVGKEADGVVSRTSAQEGRD